MQSSAYRKVLVVDRDAGTVDAIGAHEVRVIHVADLAAALDALARDPVDVAIVDHERDAGAIETCRTLRELAPWMPVIISSAQITAALRWAALRAGATRVLGKPIQPASVLSAIAESKRASEQARAMLVDVHLELAGTIAAHFARRYGSLVHGEDLRGLASLGLCQAAARFNPFRKEPFVAYACRRIRGTILDAVRGATSQTRASRSRAQKVMRARAILEGERREVTDEQVAAHLGLSVREVADAHAPTRIVLEPLDAEPPTEDERPDDLVEHAQALERTKRARRALVGAEARVVAMLYEEERSLQEVARTLKVSVARVQQIHARALAQLRRTVTVRDR